MSQNESNPQVSYDRPPVRRKRRKKTPWQKFKEAYLPLILVLVGLAVVVALIIGLVKLVSRTPAPQESNSSESQTLPTEGENQALLDQAAILAAQYDYDGALTLLGTCTNPDGEGRHRLHRCQIGSHRLAGCGKDPPDLLPTPDRRYGPGL